MKLLPLLLGSLAANVLLGYAYWRHASRISPVDAPAAVTAGAATAPTAATKAPAAPQKTAPTLAEKLAAELERAKAAPIVLDEPLRAALQSGDVRRLVPALRGSGFPEKFIRDMIIWEMGDTTKAERNKLYAEAVQRPFWQTQTRAEKQAWDAALDALDAKNLPLTKEAFGGFVPPLPQLTLDHRRYGFLPEEKIELIVDMDNDYQTLLRDALRGGGLTSERYKQIEQERRAEAAKLLSPDELRQYDLYLSPAAENLRRQMPAFQPTEQEFLAMLAARQAFEQKVGPNLPGNTSAANQQRLAEERTVDDQYRAILGDARYAEYQRGQDQGYRAAVTITNRLNLPPENAVAVYELQQTAQARLRELTATPGTNAPGVRAAAQALVTETNASLERLLGPRGAEAYRATAGWLRGLSTGPGRPGP